MPAKTRIDNRIFPMKRKKLYTSTVWVRNIVKRSVISLEGGKISSYTFRHSCATRLLLVGMDITMVQEFLGHKNIASTLDTCTP
jgi:site-specific recombinase XerD